MCVLQLLLSTKPASSIPGSLDKQQMLCGGKQSYNLTGICTADCQSSYSVISQCETPATAANFASSTCGVFKNASCSTLTQNDINYLQFAVYLQCSNGTYCSPNCSAAIAALEQYSGCCSADYLNGPKALCGQPTIAPCSTVLNSGSVAAPTSECAYALHYPPVLASRLPSVSAECIKSAASDQYCIAECQSLFALYGRCSGVQDSDYKASLACGKFNNQNCSDALTNGTNLIAEVLKACSNSTYCPSSCFNAIAAAEQYGGCCYSYFLNGPKVLCGQQPIAPCTTIFSSGSTTTTASSATTTSSGSGTITFNPLVVMIFIVATALAVYF